MSETTKKGPLWVWLDLETTGTDPSKGLVLEVAWEVTEGLGDTPLESFDAVLPHPDDLLASRLDPFVARMHAKSGLLAEVRKRQAALHEFGDAIVRSHQVDKLLFGALLPFAEEGYELCLAGYSVGSFDLQWVRHHWKLAAKLLSHRVLDVSAIRALVSQAAPELVPEKEVTHRAAEDLAAARREYLHYARALAGLVQTAEEASLRAPNCCTCEGWDECIWCQLQSEEQADG